MLRQARFICAPDQLPDQEASFRRLVSQGPWQRDDGVNRWYLFRRSFDLPSMPDSAPLNITVDGRYQLFINGRRIGRGPSRCSPYFQRVDHHDIAPYLNGGENVIAVLAHVYGVDTAWYEKSRDYLQSIFGDGGLYIDATIHCGAEVVTLRSDRTWRCLDCAAWNRDTPRSGWGQDFIEDFDAREMPDGWAAAAFDDNGWPHAREMFLATSDDDRAKGWGQIEPFPTLIPREIPQLAESRLQPERVLATYVATTDSALSIDQRIYLEELSKADGSLVDNPGALLVDDADFAVVRTRGDCGTVVLLRFEHLHSGFPFIEIDAQGGEVIEVAVAETIPGEYLGERENAPRIRRQTFLDCAHVFRYAARAGGQRFEKFEWTAVRYLQIVVRNAPHGLRIRHIGSVYTHYPVENLGAFECSDDLLNQLWEIGRYTALQCTHDAWEDCPGREKRQWFGDGIVHYLIGAAAFGPSVQAIDRQFLRHGMESQRPDGLIQMFAPGDHHGEGIIIPDFSLQWIGAALHYFEHSGDLDFIAEVFPAIQKVLAWFERQKQANGLINNLPYWHFIEWADIGREGESLVINAMLVGALRASATLASALGYARAVTEYGGQAQLMADALNGRHWDDVRGIYVDSVDAGSGQQDAKASQQGNAAMIHWDIAPRSRWDRMVERITAPERLKLTAVPPIVPEGDPFDPEHDIVLANTYFSHFVFSALGKARHFDRALAQMRRFYAPMLATGTTTLWESFDPSASLCHAFSATPVYQLSANVLGVQPSASGFSRIRIAPQTCDLEFARGIYPTPHGGVHVAWRKHTDGLEMTIDVPPGSFADVVAPPGYVTDLPQLCLNPGKHHLRYAAQDQK